MNQRFRFDHRSVKRSSLCGLVVLLLAGAATALGQDAASGPYFGQKPPGRKPELFAPGIVSLPSRMEGRLAFSPDGKECIITVPQNMNFSDIRLYYTKCVNNEWTPQVEAPFALPRASCCQPFYSADGNKVYFSSNANGSFDIWVVERIAEGWGKPQVLPEPVSVPKYDDGPYTQTLDGTAYVASERNSGRGLGGLWRITPPQSGQPQKAENLGAPIKSQAGESDPMISPEGKYLIFTSTRPGGAGGGDLYVAFADGKGGWSAPRNLNEYCPGINTGDFEYGASLSSDEHYLFFVRLSPATRTCHVYWVENPFRKPSDFQPAEITPSMGSARK